MRFLLLSALALSALPALAQDHPERHERRIVIEIDTTITDGPGHRFEIEREDTSDGPRVIMRRFLNRSGDGDADGEENVFHLRMPDGLANFSFSGEGPMRLGEGGPMTWFNGDGPALLRGFGLQPGVSEETRTRLAEKEDQARDLARRARSASGSERQSLESDLTGVLGEVFELRAEARREQAAHLREQAAKLSAEADEMESALRDRDSRRRALIEARRAELLGDRASDW